MKTIVLLFVTLALLAGCSTTDRAKGAKSLLAIGESVNAAMNVYGEMYRSGELSEEEIAKVRRIHADFQAVYSQAVKAVQYDLTQASPAELAAIASTLILTIDSL